MNQRNNGQTTPNQPDGETVSSWPGVIALATAAFIFNTTEFAPIGLLSDIGSSFNMTSQHVGLMLTIYAWVVALVSLPLMQATRRIERRRLLAAVFVTFITGHLVSALAGSFAMLVFGRLIIACAHAVFWTITAALAVRIAPEGYKGKALALLGTGTSLAMVLGIPLGKAIGDHFGWRLTFALIGLLALLVMLVLMRHLPLLPSRNSGSLKSLPGLLKRPALVCMYCVTVLGVTAHFTAYSYIDPYLLDVANVDSNMVTVSLLLFGSMGLLGSMLFSRFGLKYANIFVLATLTGMALCLLLLLTATEQIRWALFPLIGAWGMVFMCFSLSMQMRILGLASDATDVAMALYSGLFNVAIGAGALLGSQAGLYVGIRYIGFAGGAIAVLGLCVCAMTLKRYRASLEAGALRN